MFRAQPQEVFSHLPDWVGLVGMLVTFFLALIVTLWFLVRALKQPWHSGSK